MLFHFKAKNSSGEIYEGEREAKDKYALFHEIKGEGGEIISSKAVSSSGGGSSFLSNLFSFGKIKTQEKINFARNLGAMIEAGLSVTKALDVMQRQAKNKKLKKVISNLISEISKGNTLAQALEGHQKVFSKLFVSMVKAGEGSGNLSGNLKVISLQMDKTHSLERKVKGALIYPGVILFAMIIIGFLMLKYIVPNLTKTFTEMNVSLPASTKFVIYLSSFVSNHGIVILLALLIVVFIGYFWMKSLSGKKVIHYCIIHLPIFGELIKEVNTARTARTLSSLLNSGVDVVESIKITSDVLQNVYYKNILSKAVDIIKKGELMSKIFIKSDKYYPILLGEMMGVGEETGKTGEMLLNVAQYYEDDVDQRTKDMSTIIEPILMIFIGGAVGFFALSMISPMYSLVNVI